MLSLAALMWTNGVLADFTLINFIFLMPKAAKSSRWFHFIFNGLDVEKYVKTCGCDSSQWVTIDGVVKGYLFFPTTRPIPRKKLWIPGAVIEFSSREQLLGLYNNVAIDDWQYYGSDLLFVQQNIGVTTFLSPGLAKAVSLPISDSIVDTLGQMSAVEIKLANGIIFESFVVEAFLISLADPSELEDYLKSLTSFQCQLFFAKCPNIRLHFREFYSKLCDAQDE